MQGSGASVWEGRGKPLLRAGGEQREERVPAESSSSPL